MLNVNSPGRDRYIPAAPVRPLSTLDLCQLVCGILWDSLKVFVLSLPVLLKILMKIVVPEETKSIDGQTVLITGGANGIGKALALELSKRDCKIVIADIDKEALDCFVEELKLMGVQVFGYHVDVAVETEVIKLKESIDKDVGSIDILVNNAGIMPLLSLREGKFKDVERTVAVNFSSDILMLRTFINDMIERRKGHIIQIASMAVLHALPYASTYTGTRWAVAGLVNAFEEELKLDGIDYIHFTTAYPYFVATRKDLIDSIRLRIPPISPKYTAMKIVEAVIHNQRHVVIPTFIQYMLWFLKVLPTEIANLVKEHVLRQSESKAFANAKDLVVSD